MEDTAAICAKGDVGFKFSASNGSATDMPVEITLKVDGKAMKLMPKYVVTDDDVVRFSSSKPKGVKTCYGSGHKALIEDFYGCIREGRHFPIDGEEGAKVIRLILAAYKSGGKGVKI